MIKKFLCWIGIHHFKQTKLIASLINPIPMDQCKWCGCYRQIILGAGEIIYDRETVEVQLGKNEGEGDV